MAAGQIIKFSRRTGRGLLNIMLPPLCLSCDAPVESQGGVCAACWQKIRFISPPYCPVCGLPYELAQDDLPCPTCLTTPPHYRTARAAVVYDQGSRNMILGFKHADQTHLAATLARMMAQAGQVALAQCDMLAPVPLHRWRLFRRKYNQAALLAQALSRQIHIPVVPDLLLRRRATVPQGHMNASDRARNVRGAFSLNPHHRAVLAGKKVGLIDDVMTTGATVNACVDVLTGAGAADTVVLTFARTI